MEPEKFFSVALAMHVKPDKVISLQTTKAAESNGLELDTRFKGQGIDHEVVRIPDGKSEEELWKVFEAITSSIPQECVLDLDVTHGFRTLPLLSLVSLSYLRVTRKVQFGGVYYGAWEAGNKEEGTTPVFDITPFLSLLDWTSAAEQFIDTGSANKLASLLESAQQSLWRNPGSLSRADLPRVLKSLATSLRGMSSNLLLLRTGEIAESTERLKGLLGDAKKEAKEYARPFMEVVSSVEKELTKFPNTDLSTLRDLVSWLAEREQTAAALTLAREWLTSYAMEWCGVGHVGNNDARSPYSDAINKLAIDEIVLKREDAKAAYQTLTDRLSEEQRRQLSQLISRIRDARNDLNHAGFNNKPSSADALVDRAKRVAEDLGRLPLP